MNKILTIIINQNNKNLIIIDNLNNKEKKSKNY